MNHQQELQLLITVSTRNVLLKEDTLELHIL